MNNSLQNGNGSNTGYDSVNPLNTSFNNHTNSAEQKITRGVILLSDTELELHQEHGFRDQLFLVDEKNKRVYAFRKAEIPGIIERVYHNPEKHSDTFFIELKKGIKPYYWPVEKGSPMWPQANIEEAYQEFKKTVDVNIPISSFKGMLRHSYYNDYEKFLRRESELNSVMYDERGKLRKTTSFDFDNTPSKDGLCPRLFFAHNGKVFSFKGKSIQGIAAVVNNIRGEMEADGKHFSSTFKIVIPSDVKHFYIFPMPNEKLWPQYSLQSAYEDFKKATIDTGVRLSPDEFSTFLSECYPAHYERIVTIQDQVSEYINRTGRQPQIVTINTYKFNRNEPHSDISITAPDGQKWIISHEAKIGTEIEGVCKVIYEKHREDYREEDYTHEIIVEDGVKACAKLYGQGAKYPYHYFANSDVYKEGTPFVFSTPTSTKLKKIPLKGGISNTQKQKDNEQDNKKPEDKTSQDGILSAEEAIKKLTLGQ